MKKRNHHRHLLIVALLCLIFTAAPAQKAPVTIADTVSFSLINDTMSNISWGTAGQGDKIVYFFRLKNNSGDSLVINKITTGDGGCYAEDRNGNNISSIAILKESEFVFRITQSTKGKSGRINHPITIYYTDPAGVLHTRTFTFYGTIK